MCECMYTRETSQGETGRSASLEGILMDQFIELIVRNRSLIYVVYRSDAYRAVLNFIGCRP